MGILTINNAACNLVIYPVSYGLLYNWAAVTDVRNIAPIGFRVPTRSDFATLRSYLSTNEGGKLKEIGLTYWDAPNTGATNEVGFNVRGSGIRSSSSGVFALLKSETRFWTSTQYSANGAYIGWLTNDESAFYEQADNKKEGNPVRFIKETTELTHGQTSIVIGNDGKIYPTICIGNQEYTAYNSAETRFRTGEIIPWYGADQGSYFTNAEWIILATAGCSAYENELSNVATGFVFPT